MPKGVYKHGPAWNRGLTKENDSRVATYGANSARTRRERHSQGGENHSWARCPGLKERVLGHPNVLKTHFQKGHVPINKGIPGPKGETAHHWLGEGIKYSGIHLWLIKVFGKASECDNIDCLGKSKVYDYALIKGEKYERKRENFMKLCRSCHIRYDEISRKGWETKRNKK